MTGLVVVSSPADQGGPQAYAKEFLSKKPTLLEAVTVVNKGASAAYVQVFDSPRKLDVAITNTNNVTGAFTATAHLFETGDNVTITGITGITAGYLRATTANAFTLYSTRALAQAGGTPDLLPTNNGESGTVTLTSNYNSAPTCEEYPILPEANKPANVLSLVNARFNRGLYIRGVTAINGSTLIAATDLKFTPRYRHAPVKNEIYED